MVQRRSERCLRRGWPAPPLIVVLSIVTVICGCRDTVGVDQRASSSPTPPDIDFPDCRYDDPVFDTGILESEHREIVPEPLIVDGDIIVHRRATSFSNSPNDLEVYRIDPRTSAESQITANDGDDILFDARDDAYLIARTDPSNYTQSVIYRTGERETVLLSELDHRPHYLGDSHARLVNDRAATFVDFGQVYLYVDGELDIVSDGWRDNMLPDLQGTAVVWAGSDGSDREIVMATSDETRQLTDNDVHDWQPLLSGSMVFWLADSTAMAMDWQTEQTTIVDQGPCFGLVAADSGRAAFVCDTADVGPESSTFWLGGRRIVLYDGQSARELISTSGQILAVDIDAGGVAWTEYPPDTDWGAPFDGAVYYLPYDMLPDAAPYEVARLGSGCWTCGAYWPPPRIRLEGDLLAWSYGLQPDYVPQESEWPWQDTPSIGYAVISSPLSCR